MLAIASALPLTAVEPGQLLAQIRRKMSDNLARLPDYTCRETIERSRRPAGAKRFAFTDRLRIEVSYVSGKELFAWPGAEKFEERPLMDMLPGGPSGTGSFGLHARAIFASEAATFEYKGETQVKDRRLAGWSFQIPREKSKYSVSNGRSARVIVGYSGSFQADAETLDLVWLEVQTDEVPAPITIVRGTERMEYQRVRIGASEFLLPRTSDLYMTGRDGNESHNHTDFAACRQYSGESVVRFGDPDAEPAASTQPARPLEPLPPNVEVELLVKNGIHIEKSAIGDPVRATLLRPVKLGEKVLAPKDAVVSGRISRMEQRQGRLGRLFVIGVLFESIEHGKRRGPFRGHLDAVSFPSNRRYVVVPSGKDDLPGEGMFAVYGDQSDAVFNLRMVWRTVNR
jgi:hypothetical protein